MLKLKNKRFNDIINNNKNRFIPIMIESTSFK